MPTKPGEVQFEVFPWQRAERSGCSFDAIFALLRIYCDTVSLRGWLISKHLSRAGRYNPARPLTCALPSAEANAARQGPRLSAFIWLT